MRDQYITAEPFHFLNIMDVKAVMTINEHGIFQMTGLISEEEAKKYMRMPKEETWVEVNVKDESGVFLILFYGVLTGLDINEIGQTYELTITLHTGTFLLDDKPHIRSFQDELFTYEDVLRTYLGAGSAFIMRDRKMTQTKAFFMQYRETDWQFAVRLANHAGSFLIPENTVKGKYFYIGCCDDGEVQEITTEEYTLVKNYEINLEEGIGLENYIRKEPGMYEVWSREIYRLGSPVAFQGLRMHVCKIVTELRGAELWHEYSLAMLRETPYVKIMNHSLQGLSLRADVIDVHKDKVQISLHDDENKTNCGHRWFEYSTVYSTPDGTGWYCMPEIGDEVRVVFENDTEADSYVVSSVHLAASLGRVNPDEKSWKNKQNKEILLTPQSLIFTNNNGLSVELIDGEGIKILSNQNIAIEADGSLSIKSNLSDVGVNAVGSIALNQGAAAISIADSIDITGGKINMN